MAAAALCNPEGRYPEQCAAPPPWHWATCWVWSATPVAGLVEVPCIKRNVVGAVNAVSLRQHGAGGGGLRHPLRRGHRRHGPRGQSALPDLRETGQGGGLAATPTGVKIARQLAQEG